jgi:hypothetical protein
MVADIKLEDNVVSVEDTDPAKPIALLKIKARDLELDASDRRKNQTEHRRALVHGPGDTLVINWGPDYPGGVTIDGEVKFLGAVNSHAGISIRPPPNNIAGNYLRITNECIEFHTYKGGFPPKYDVFPLDRLLVEEVRKLRTQVDELMKKVK